MMKEPALSRPLHGIRIIEIAAIGPAPYGVMLLSDLGADVIRIDRLSSTSDFDTMGLGLAGGRRSVALDLKSEEGIEKLLDLVDHADVLVEGFRPGVADRLGFGPECCMDRNPRLIYAQVTGWGQSGPLRERAGHDINYAALSGALHAIGRHGDPPTVPLNYLADFGGGGTFLAIGVLAGLIERAQSGVGQTIDVAMIDGVSSLSTFFHGLIAVDEWNIRRESNMLDGAAPFYRTYETSDGRFLAVGCIEPQFYAEFLSKLGLPPEEWPQFDRPQWPTQAAELADIFRSHTRNHWSRVFQDSDACVTPVLDFLEARDHPHMQARSSFMPVGDMVLPAPVPRFGRTPAASRSAAPLLGADSANILSAP
jgi:alpha-methylacyl-CoA racemase